MPVKEYWQYSAKPWYLILLTLFMWHEMDNQVWTILWLVMPYVHYVASLQLYFWECGSCVQHSMLVCGFRKYFLMLHCYLCLDNYTQFTVTVKKYSSYKDKLHSQKYSCRIHIQKYNYSNTHPDIQLEQCTPRYTVVAIHTKIYSCSNTHPDIQL